MKELKIDNSQIARWAIKLDNFPFSIKYRPGKLMGHADALSRLPLPLEEGEAEKIEAETVLYARILPTLKLEDLTEFQKIKETILENSVKEITDDVPSGKAQIWHNGGVCILPSKEEAEKNPKWSWAKDLQSIMGENKIILNENTLLVGDMAYVSEGDAWKIMQWIHEHPGMGSHCGPNKLLALFKERFLAPLAYTVANEVCRDCWRCQQAKDHDQHIRAPLKPFVSKQPWELMSLDFVGPYPRTQRQNQFLLVAVDAFSRFLIMVPIPNTKTDCLIRVVTDRIFSIFGTPRTILTDQGAQFESHDFQNFCQDLGIKKIRTSPYHPQTNGMNERTHRGINNALRAIINDEKEWDKIIPWLQLAHNNSVNKSTKFSPSQLMLGRNALLPCDLLLTKEAKDTSTVNKNVEDYQKRWTAWKTEAEENQQKAKIEQKKNYDKKANSHHYTVGQSCWKLHILKPGENSKLALKWDGPFEILQVEDNGVLTLKNQGGKITRIHVNLTKPCRSSQRLIDRTTMHMNAKIHQDKGSEAPST